MRKALVALVAIVTLALAAGLVAAPKPTNSGYEASMAGGFDILGIIRQARDLPEHAYPAH